MGTRFLGSSPIGRHQIFFRKDNGKVEMKPLDVEEIKALIVYRMGKFEESCNSHHKGCVLQQIRALTSVLFDGEPTDGGTPYDLCKMLDIPVDDDGVTEEWMLAHGFEDREGSSHEKFGGW